MILPPPQVVFDCYFFQLHRYYFDIKYSPFGEDDDEILDFPINLKSLHQIKSDVIFKDNATYIKSVNKKHGKTLKNWPY